MDKAQKTKAQKITRQRNVLESLRDFGTDASKNLLNQVFGSVPLEKKYSGDITPGESLEFKELFSGQHDEKIKFQKQLALERRLTEEEKIHAAQKTNELKLQLQALMQEVLTLAKTTQSLGEQVEVAAMQAPAQPGIYHIVFFEKLLEFVRSFRKKIEDASVWLSAVNKRSEKKNYWAMYKKKGASFLLAPDHYLQRSAG